LLFSDVGPSNKHHLASPPFEIAKRPLSPVNERTPEYIKLQLEEQVARHQTRVLTRNQEPPDADSRAGLYQLLADCEIRVLELLPASFDAPLHGKLHTTSLKFENKCIERYTMYWTLFEISTADRQPICYPNQFMDGERPLLTGPYRFGITISASLGTWK
jgi:hypothetical protein